MTKSDKEVIVRICKSEIKRLQADIEKLDKTIKEANTPSFTDYAQEKIKSQERQIADVKRVLKKLEDAK